MGVRKFIYTGSLDAFTYLAVFVLSMLVPTIISWVLKQDLLLFLTMAINSFGLVREYVLLFQSKKVIKRFWIERLVGTTASLSIFIYSLSALLFIFQGVDCIAFKPGKIIFSILFAFPGVISALEGIIYITEDYKENVVTETTIVATATAVDV